MISREDALKSLESLTKNNNLPESLLENKIKAEPLLFREAQLNYTKHRRALQRQIVVDNLHFCTQ